jgi:hypothetical protein
LRATIKKSFVTAARAIAARVGNRTDEVKAKA